jgi:hypothetical protein
VTEMTEHAQPVQGPEGGWGHAGRPVRPGQAEYVLGEVVQDHLLWKPASAARNLARLACSPAGVQVAGGDAGQVVKSTRRSRYARSLNILEVE